MEFAPQDQCYTEPPECALVVFDIRLPGGAESFHRQRAAWQAQSDIEALDENHYVLLIFPGGALEAAA